MKKIILNSLVVLSLSSVLLSAAGCGRDETVIEFEEDKVLSDTDLSVDSKESYPSDVKEPKDDSVTVYVCGAVDRPGVYRLAGGSRIVNAIEAAGGILDDADRDYINQAMLLTDEMKVYVPTVGETEDIDADMCLSGVGAVDEGMNSGKVNINTGTAEELMSLPGIGQAKAALIIEYRTANGSFSSIEDIMKINGIKEGMFNKIRDKICI